MIESKETIRGRYKGVRAHLSEERRNEAKRAAAEIDCGSAGPVLSFASLSMEIDTSALNDRLFAQGRLVLPVVVDGHLICRRVDDLSDLKRGTFGILEPTGASAPPEEIAFALIPGLAFDIFGGRIGHGFGYYDRLLPRLKGKVGLCFKEQLSKERLPTDPWDIPVDDIIAL